MTSAPISVFYVLTRLSQQKHEKLFRAYALFILVVILTASLSAFIIESNISSYRAISLRHDYVSYLLRDHVCVAPLSLFRQTAVISTLLRPSRVSVLSLSSHSKCVSRRHDGGWTISAYVSIGVWNDHI